MEWLIIVLVLMLIVSPVLWLKPKPRQKRIAGLRNTVMKAGIKVKLDKPPLNNDPGLMPSYRWPYPADYPGATFVLVREDEASNALKVFRPGWRWRIEPLRPLPAGVTERLEYLLTRLPRDAIVIESNREALKLWWDESQDGERFTSYLDDFNYLRKHLAGRPDAPAPRWQGFQHLRDGEPRE
ncbi:preprotein translocase subunit YajC [Aidingimonas lacisalsi]|uniref:preprotein translocase subunit YajC n=1 Tax=Aidingimonas lacisalsi TaxID=2604086 RepID=UPI0011D186B5|nr:preprotein translocase subunit YajC [Aidingimonas lacisalsi]